MSSYPDEFPGLRVWNLTPGIRVRFYKHWGQHWEQGEGLKDPHAVRPCVVQARLYSSDKGEVSAVFSYPNGIGVRDGYFWEIWSGQLLDDIERFDDEDSMEQRIKELLMC